MRMSSLRLLVVDDDTDFVEGMVDLLTAHGYSVQTASHGEEAVEKSRQEEFDAIFMDVNLPGKNGWETLQEIRRSRPNVKGVMMTGCTPEHLMKYRLPQRLIDECSDQIGEGSEGSQGEILTKPFSPGKLVKILGGIVESKETQSPCETN